MMRPIANATCMDSSVRALRGASLALQAFPRLEDSDAQRQREDRQAEGRASAPAPVHVRPARRADARAPAQVVEEDVERVGPAAAGAEPPVQRADRGSMEPEEAGADGAQAP